MPGGKTTNLYRETPSWPGRKLIEPHERSPSSTRIPHRSGALVNRLEGLSSRSAPCAGRISRAARGDPAPGLGCSWGPGSLTDPPWASSMYRDLRRKAGFAVSPHAIHTEILPFFTVHCDDGWIQPTSNCPRLATLMLLRGGNSRSPQDRCHLGSPACGARIRSPRVGRIRMVTSTPWPMKANDVVQGRGPTDPAPTAARPPQPAHEGENRAASVPPSSGSARMTTSSPA